VRFALVADWEGCAFYSILGDLENGSEKARRHPDVVHNQVVSEAEPLITTRLETA